MKKFFVVLSLTFATEAFAKQSTLIDELSQALQARTAKAPATGLIESAFSPDAGSEELVLKVINASERSIRLAAYSFTSPPIVKALRAAKKRGVDVRVIVDEKGNKGKSSIAALNLLVNAGIPTRSISTYAIYPDKYIISDERHVQNGSFNYSQAAAAYFGRRLQRVQCRKQSVRCDEHRQE
ncbi:phospholipase D-like domain-containing protein [Herbaspirillum sp. ST 5-3]|uniref:phospholipase D-like domain-containing protein n=1 Tax=Oxalobacteraceae TaxID=75682 RepID=UPI0010A33718|nr:phospholipase D-like domain-containing protein [Herbaspirillum sp. ST 5-3]